MVAKHKDGEARGRVWCASAVVINPIKACPRVVPWNIFYTSKHVCVLDPDFGALALFRRPFFFSAHTPCPRKNPALLLLP